MTGAGRVAAAVSGSSAATAAAATARPARRGAAIRAGTQARAASTAPQGRIEMMSRTLPRFGIVETTYTPNVTTMAAHSNCSALLALRHDQMTRAKPNAAAIRHANPNSVPAKPSLAPASVNAPNMYRMFCRATTAWPGQARGGARWLRGGSMAYPPRRSMSSRARVASG